MDQYREWYSNKWGKKTAKCYNTQFTSFLNISISQFPFKQFKQKKPELQKILIITIKTPKNRHVPFYIYI